MDQGMLIDLVQQYKHLYDKRHKDFRSKLAKQNAWETIASIMGYPREEVETTWNSLRNRFVTERRKLRCIPTGSAATTEWRFFQQMTFLEEHVAVRRTLGNISNSEKFSNILFENDSETEGSQVVDLQSEEDIFSQPSNSIRPSTSTQPSTCTRPSTPTEPSTSTQPSTSTRPSTSTQPPASHKENIHEMKNLKKKRNATTDLERSIVATLGTMESVLKTSNEVQNSDEDILFGQSIGSSLKLIKNRKNKAKAKAEICLVLEKYEEE